MNAIVTAKSARFARIVRNCGAFAMVVPMCFSMGAPQSPSELAKTKASGEGTVTFVLVERSDLRLLYCSNDVLQSRIQRRVCVVDEIFKGPREIVIEPGQTVREVLKTIGKKPGRMQVRLITRNAIEQTPFLDSVEQSADLLDRKIQPGDFLVLAART